MSAMNGYIHVDLDGTLATINGPGKNYEMTSVGQVWIGNPVPLMLERVKKMLAEGKDVRIFTARVSPKSGNEWVEACRRAINSWCLEHIGKALPITCEKDYGMLELWDDRAIGVVCDTGELKCCKNCAGGKHENI
jgi:hypothetical protein